MATPIHTPLASLFNKYAFVAPSTIVMPLFKLLPFTDAKRLYTLIVLFTM